jgi:fatty-acyl-CoA synthase
VKFDPIAEQPILDRDGRVQLCDDDEVGEILGCINAKRPNQAFTGYTNAEATQKKIISGAFHHGDHFFRSGDLVRMDSSGFVYFVDRIGDTFRWKGENVSTNEVADALSRCAGVEEANVCVRSKNLDFFRARARDRGIDLFEELELSEQIGKNNCPKTDSQR